MSQSFNLREAHVTITDAGSFVLLGVVDGDTPTPPDPPTPPTPGVDQVDLSTASIAASPDVRFWPIGANLTSVYINPINYEVEGRSADMNVDFSKLNGPGAWPFVNGPEGEIQYTLWVGCRILGIWYFCAAIPCISRGPGDNYVPTGPTLMPGQLPSNWYYFAGSPLAGYQPAPGESVAWFLTAGFQRRQDIHTVAERTQVVLTPFTAGTYHF